MKNIIILFTLIACLSGGLLNAQAPANDACADATMIMALPFVDNLDATNATNNEGSIVLENCGFGMNDGVWYSFTGTGRDVSIVLITDDFDAEIGIYKGECSSLECIKNVDNSATGGESVIIPTFLGVDYLVNIGNWDTDDGPEGNFILEISSDTTDFPICETSLASNNLENGFFIQEGGQQVAADFVVSVNTPTTVISGLSANMLAVQEIESVDLIFYEDDNGVPGVTFGDPISDLAPSSQTLLGTDFGFNFYEVIFDLPESREFPGTSDADTRYWIQIVAKSSDPDANLGWESNSSKTIGSALAFIPDGAPAGQWSLAQDAVAKDDCVFTLFRECTFVEGCFAASNFIASERGFTDALLTWSSAITPENGYNLKLFNTGDNPSVDDPIYDLNIGADFNFTEVSDLITENTYDAYLTSLCSDGESVPVKLTFTTRFTPANDDLCGAISLEIDAPCNDAAFSNTDASTQENEPEGDCFAGGAQKTVWFSFVAPDNGSVSISTDISPATLRDSEIALYAAPTDCTDPTTLGEALACAQDNGVIFEFNSIIDIATLTPGETYFIQVSGYINSEGDFCIEVQKAADCPAVEGLTSTSITQTEVTLTWDEAEAASNGYEVSVFETGADPATATPIYNENIGADNLVLFLEGLTPGSRYDAYLLADCGEKGPSLLSEPYTFSTAPAAPLCEESFYDSGGADRNYQNNEQYSMTIEPIDATSIITLTLTAVDVEAEYDFLRIYDGENTDASELSPAENGVTEPGTYTSSVAGGKLHITFASDSGVNGDGWEGSVSCTFSSLDELSPAAFKIFPNPVSNNLILTAAQDIERVEVLNLMGQKVIEEYPHSNKANLNVSQLREGSYLIRTEIDGKIGTKKFIKL